MFSTNLVDNAEILATNITTEAGQMGAVLFSVFAVMITISIAFLIYRLIRKTIGR